jgi:F0F1-type ATP synthase alpha subunit
VSNAHFEKLVESGNPVGEVTSIDRFLVTISGLHPVNLRALIMFEDGSKGVVNRILDDGVLVLHIGESSRRIILKRGYGSGGATPRASL